MSEVVPLASVIVVCWNSADVIGSCLDHLLAQDYPAYEIVVVDDGSQDSTLDVAEDALSSGKLTIVESPLNRGCPHARNLGLRHATGEIIAFIDADGFASPSWLTHIVDAFADPTVGGVASSVFLDANPLVLNGAGGIVNRQGWAADLSMNVPYEEADLASEALYPMGCGMAVRRSAVDRVGPFDDRMLNYYDDVDYGIRLWRAGYRVIVAPDAWIDHGFGQSGGDSPHKQLLCEQHRMRVVLKHSPVRVLARWALHEALATRRAAWPRRDLKLKAMRWNARHLPSTLMSRRRLRGAPGPPVRLVDPSWGEDFPAGVAPMVRPSPASASDRVDMANPEVGAALPYGWFPMERIDGRSYRWAGPQAAAVIRLEAEAEMLRLEYAHPPRDTGGIDMSIRRLGSPDPLTPVWSTRLSWQYIARCVENHPLALPAGDYEVVFRAREAWSDPPGETRPLGFALASMAFEPSYDIPIGGLDMASPEVEQQLVSGWFEPEMSADRSYRWGGSHAAAVARVTSGTLGACIRYCLPPGPIGGLNLTVRRLGRRRVAWSTRLPWLDSAWHEDYLPLHLPAGDYLLSLDAEATWSNPGRRDPGFSPENRSLGFALSSLRFDEAAQTPRRL